MNFSPFSCPIFLGRPIRERPLLPKRTAALWEGPVPFGRNRESRSREAAGRRNWPEAVLYKGMSRETSSPRLGADRIFLSAFSLTDRACTHNLRVVFLQRPLLFLSHIAEQLLLPLVSILR